MPSTTQSVWGHIDVPLPKLKYQNITGSGQGKGSTEWAAHSHTPVGVQLWNNFDSLVIAEGQKPRNSRTLDLDFLSQLGSQRLGPVSREEDVTNRIETILLVFSEDPADLSGGFNFPQQNQQIIGKPDLIAQQKDAVGLGVEDWSHSQYRSPEPGKRAQVRRESTDLIVSLYRMPFETKPIWKFQFLTSTEVIIREWAVPEDFDATRMQANSPLPKLWSREKKKVFHLVRQLYGQMVADQRRYGILTLYERWFFCERTEEGILKISRSFEREETSPSILQAIKTMVGFVDHNLACVQLHPQSASKAPRAKKTKRNDDSNQKSSPLPPAYCRKDGSDGDRKGGTNLAASLYPWDCSVYDVTDSVLLLKTTKDPSVIIKMQSDPQNKHVADEMAHEAEIFAALEGNELVQEVIPRFRGHSTHFGVAMTCTEQELDDFDDIGLENVSYSLKKSAVHAVEALSSVGILHNDIELRNIVKSKSDPSHAKIIDFGRASWSDDFKLLAKQVEDTKILLNLTGS